MLPIANDKYSRRLFPAKAQIKSPRAVCSYKGNATKADPLEREGRPVCERRHWQFHKRTARVMSVVLQLPQRLQIGQTPATFWTAPTRQLGNNCLGTLEVIRFVRFGNQERYIILFKSYICLLCRAISGCWSCDPFAGRPLPGEAIHHSSVTGGSRNLGTPRS